MLGIGVRVKADEVEQKLSGDEVNLKDEVERRRSPSQRRAFPIRRSHVQRR